MYAGCAWKFLVPFGKLALVFTTYENEKSGITVQHKASKTEKRKKKKKQQSYHADVTLVCESPTKIEVQGTKVLGTANNIS